MDSQILFLFVFIEPEQLLIIEVKKRFLVFQFSLKC